MAAPFPIVDAHQHFWDPRVNYHSWLCDQPPIPFRYGDYSRLR
ncbi:MAG: amidohydrolase family protein, partial [Pseudomonadota bacterium]